VDQISNSERESQDPEIPSRLTVLVGVLTFAGVAITISAAPAWAVGAVIGAALSTCALHRLVWRPRPSTWGLLSVLLLTVVTGAGTHILVEDDSRGRVPAEERVERTLLSGGVGQIEAGNIARASADGTSGTYSDPLVAAIGSPVIVAIRLSNGGPDELVGTRVTASLPKDAASSLSVELVARPNNAHPATVGDTATIDVRGSASACISYVPGSTRLFDQHLGLIRDLPDGIVGDGVSIGSLGVPIEDTRFVSLELETTAAKRSGDCG